MTDEHPGMPCQCCGTPIPDIMDIVTIRVPGRRPARVCKECLNTMWQVRSPYGEAADDV